MKKRIISLILVMSMLFSMSQTAIAASLPEQQDDIASELPLTGSSESDEIPSDPFSEEYREWKEGQVSELTRELNESSENQLLLVSSADRVSGNNISNEYLTLTTESSSFRYYTVEGDPDSTTDNNCRLLYNGTSRAIIMIDGTTYQYYGYDSEVEDNSAVYSYAEYDEVTVEQVFSFVYNPYTKRNDTVEFKYIMTNNGDSPKSIGTRLFFDIMLGGNDRAPFKIPGYGDVTTATEFTQDNMFQVWQSFDNLQNPTVIASGTLYNNVSEKPDRIQFLNYGSGSHSGWECAINEGSSLGDTAINFYFDPTEVQPGETKVVKTYYGLSALQGGENVNLGLQAFAPAELVKDEETNSYLSNPFTVNGFVENKTDELLTNVTATLNLPEGLTTADPLTVTLDAIESGENKPIAWQIEALPHYKDSDLLYTITLAADEVEEETTEFVIHLPRLLDDYGNFPGEKDGFLTLDEETAAKLEIAEDADCFVFTAPETGTYAFESLSSTVLEGQLSADGELLEVLSVSGTDENFYLIAELEADEVYCLQVSGCEDSVPCDYSVQVNQLSDEAGNHFVSAREIGEKEMIAASINYPCDIDIFRFIPMESGWYTAAASGKLAPAYLELYDADFNILVTNEFTFDGQIIYKLDEGSTYYIKVMHTDNEDKDTAGTGMYFLEVSYDDIPPVVDTISPSLNQRINEELEISVYAHDNVEVDIVTLMYSYDSKDWLTYGSRTADNDRSAVFTVDTREFEDGTVYISAEAADENGNVSTDNPVNTYIIDNTPPEQVLFENALSTVGANYLSWTKVTAEDAAGYRLYRSAGSNDAPVLILDVTDINTLFYVDTDVVTGSEYVYSITAYDTLGQESIPDVSDVIITDNDMESDIAVRNLTVIPDGTSLFVGEYSQITAAIEYVDGSTKDVTSMLTYTFDNDGLEIDASGRIRALSAGNTVLSVTVGSREICIPFVIKSLSASISSDIIVGNGTEQLSVIHYTLDGTTDVTAMAEYDVDHPEVLEVSPEGEVTARTTGTAVITITYEGESETISISVFAPPGKVTDVNVPDQATDISVDQVLTWLPTSATDSYNIYLWQGEPETPARPTQTNLTATMYRPYNLKYNTTYYWQVESVNPYASTFSEIYTFSTLGLPDLQCTSVSVPEQVFSESKITVSWEVTNNGTRTTDDRQWYDVVYLCPGSTFDSSTAIFLGQKMNYTYLDVGESYRNEASFTIPRGTVGKYYVFVMTNSSYSVRELDNTNNRIRSDGIDIELCPQPDLAVTEVETSLRQIISGSKMTVTWKVENTDAEIPENANISGWLDGIYLSVDEVLSNDDVALGSAPVSVLEAGREATANNFYANKKYTASREITIPQNVFGEYYIIVLADATDKIYENNSYNNNNCTRIQITLDPPADITVADANVESVLAPNAAYTITWTDVNEGIRDVSGAHWIDRIFLSTDEVLDTSAAYQIADVRGVKADRVNSVDVTIPYYLEGEYYLHIVADIARSIFEYGTYANNTYTQKVTISKRNLPDLSVASLDAPASATADQMIDVIVRVDNVGTGSTVENSWMDAVYLSETKVPDGTAVSLKEVMHRGNIAPDGSYTVTFSVRIPADCVGTYYLFAETDSRHHLTEAGDRTNNTTPCAVIEISPRIASDLQVVEATSSGIDAAAGAVLAINWTVANTGEGTVDRGWRDSVYLSTSAENPFEGQSVRLENISHDVILEPGESLDVSRNVILSGRLNASYYIYVVTDIDDAVYEGDNETNNFRKVALITVNEDGEEEKIEESIDLVFTQVSDLEVVSITVPEEAEAGEPVEIGWKVTNNAELQTNSSSWTDTVYLAAEDDELLDGIVLGEITHRGHLNPGESYEASASFDLPITLSGSYRIKVAADRRGSVYDENRENNELVSEDVLYIHEATPVDFRVELDPISETVTTGQPLTVSWEVINQSEAAAEGKWFDSVYLAYTAATKDIKLKDVQNPANLGPGESYRQTVTVTLPSNITGPMYLVVNANNTRSSVYELEFGNNTQVQAVVLEEMSPVDLTVANISIPAVAYPGDQITVSWDVVNLSTQSMKAKMTDNVYISADDQWDINDIPVGELTRMVSLEGNAKTYESLVVAMPDYENLSRINSSLTDEMPGVREGQYYVIIRTDVHHQVNENNKANNRVASASTLNSTVPVIAVGDTESGVLRSQNERFFRFSANGSESINVILTCADAESVNELYVSYNKIPTAHDYDYKFTEPMSADHSVVIPVAQKGEYYIYIKNVSADSTGTDFDLTVESVDYGLLDVYPKEADKGKVTVKMTGSLLEPNLTAALSMGKIRVQADEIYYFDSSNVYATFDLTYVPNGTYALEVDCSGKLSILEDCFTVDDTLQRGELNISMNVPSSYLLNSVGSATLRYKNIGYTDIAAPILVIDAEGVMFRKSDETEFSSGPMVLYAFNNDGPAGILTPGSEFAYNFAFKATKTGDISYNISTYDQIDDLGIEKILLDESSEDSERIDYILQKELGTTGKSYQEALSEVASYHSQFGYRTHDPDELVLLLYNSLLGLYTSTAISVSEDMKLKEGGLETGFMRQYLSAVTERNEKSYFGYGWKTSFDGYAEVENGQILISYPEGFRLFEKTDGVYKEITGTATASVSGGIVTVEERNGTVTTYGTNGKPTSTTYTSGEKITINYDGDKITSVVYPTVTLNFTYSGDYVSRITSSTGEQVTYSYTGDYLTSVTTEKGTVYYEYDVKSFGPTRNALTQVTYPDGNSTYFEYDENGRLYREQNNSGAGAMIYRYGAGGQVSVTNAVGGTTQMFFDHNGYLVRTVDPDGLTTETVISPDGLRSEVTEGLFARSTYIYNESGDIVSYTNPLGNTISTAYDEFGNIVSVVDEKGYETQYSYRNGNLENITYSDGTAESYEYNILNQLIRQTDRNGASITYSYDGNGNLESKRYSDGSVVRYTYDADNNVTSVTDSTGTTSLEYDEDRNVTKVTYGDGKSIGYAYDDFGRTVRMTDAENVGTNYVYDSLGRLSKVTDDDGNLIVKYAYDKMSRLTKKTNGNGTYTVYTYTSGGNVKKLVNYTADKKVNSEFTYRYDRFGNISEIKTKEGTYRYEYDLMKQLISATDVDGTTTRYTYDATGNRVSEQTGDQITYYAVNELNQYTKVGGTRYSYDAAGNLIAKTDDQGTTTYTYDIDGNLVKAASPLGIWEYTYNAMGLRTSMTVDGEETTYLNDMSGLGNIAAEYRDGEVTKYVHGLGLEMLSNADGEYFYDSDLRGSVVGLTDETGSYVNKYSYSPFGEVTVIREDVHNSFRYIGYYGVMDDGSGLNYIRARYYDPTAGRFLSLDNYGQNIRTNGYIYSVNNPILYIDVDGDLGILALIIGGAIIGACVNTAVGFATGDRGWDLVVDALSGGVAGGIGGGLSVTTIGWLAAAAPYISSFAGSLISNSYDFFVKKEMSGMKFGIKMAAETLFGGFFGSKFGSFIEKFFPINSGGIKRIHKLASIFIAKSSRNWLLNTSFGELAGNISSFFFGKLFDGIWWLSEALWKFFMNIFASLDPNDIIGPASYGDANWVAADAKLDYMIRCENDPEFATAPVHELIITHELDDSLDLRTFRLGSYGFGGLVFEVPENKALYQTRLDLREEMGLYVDIWAGLDIVSGVATWKFTAIDPETGTIPTDPLVGFLPVNNKETGDGEGFVTYTIHPKKTVENGEVIDAVATIVFDNNAPIDTPKIFNTVDTEKPESLLISAVSLSETETVLEWTADDNEDGSGYAGADIYVSVDMSPFVHTATVLNTQKAIINTEPGRKYDFFVRAVDNAGNAEALKDAAEQSVDNGFVMQTVSAPEVKTLLRGSADEIQLIELTTETEGADIFYTTNGEVPTTESAKYTEPFAVENLTTVMAIAVKQGMTESDVTEFLYEYVDARGDIDGDGEITPADRMILSRTIAGWEGYPIEAISLEMADIDGDGEITPHDRMILTRHIAGWEGYESLESFRE